MTVAIVGAGLAGLAAATRLHAAGRDVVVLEGSDGVGGRVRTDVVDGFRLDRGFQVLLTGYPAAQSQLDLEALEMRPFRPGVQVRVDGGFSRLADPLRDPVGALSAIRSPVLTIPDGLRLLKLRAEVLRPPGQHVARRPQVTTAERLAAAGFSDRIVEGFFRPFLTGVFFDPDLRTSSRMFELVFRSFFRGDVAVPADGMGAMTAQLASHLPVGTVRLNTPVTGVTSRAVALADGSVVEAEHVIVATDGPAATQLLGDAVQVAPGLGSTTLWWSAPTSPVGAAELVLDADRSGPVNTLAVMSDVAPRYAPSDRALVCGAVTGIPGETDLELDRAARAQLRRWYGTKVDGWELLRVDRIAYAQPRQEPTDLPTLARGVAVEEGLWVCGDHRDTASIQGALVSGRRTADAVLAA